MTSIVVTGGAGLVGSHLCSALRDQGAIATAIFRLGKYARLEKSFDDVNLALKANLVPRSSLPAQTECFKEELQARAAVK